MKRDNTADYAGLFLNNVPLFDTRAPVEFKQGAFPNAVNLPLMLDDERAAVGTCYKQQGQEAAIALGHKLVCGEVKAQRVAAWKAFAETHPQGYLYCFRGGLRSRISQQWLAEAGINYPFVEGGYKAMRRFLIDTLERKAKEQAFVVLGGRTGTGKTKVIDRVRESIDLEGLAHHRGSSFGRRVQEQPGQIDFENRLAIAFLQQERDCPGTLLLEDESKLIGRNCLPIALHESMLSAPLILLDEPLDVRIDTVIEDYVLGLSAEYCAILGDEQGMQDWAKYLLDSLHRVRKRLGHERYGAIRQEMMFAIQHQQEQGDLTPHRIWIAHLLSDYYDPMYDYQLGKKQHRVVFSGNRQAIIDWFADYRGCSFAR